jgi:hypothetical protein
METETILKTIRLWKDQPEKAQVKPAVTARAEGSQAVIEAGSLSWRADLPGPLGGASQAPSPTLLVPCGSLQTSDLAAERFGIRTQSVRPSKRTSPTTRPSLINCPSRRTPIG